MLYNIRNVNSTVSLIWRPYIYIVVLSWLRPADAVEGYIRGAMLPVGPKTS